VRILILGFVLLLSFAALNPARAASTESAYFNPDDSEFVRKFLKPGTFMRASEVKNGMEGYGLSVFHGTKIERFNFRVIGVMKRVNNGRDAILVRLSGAAMGKNNVIRGMSGSPIYIDDKLVGAVSYGFDFSTEPIAGITPIIDMLDAMAKPEQAPEIGSRIPLRKPGFEVTPSVVSAGNPDLGRFKKLMVSAASPHMVPLMSPVSLSGFSSRAQQYLRGRFESVGLSVSEGSGGGSDTSHSAEDIKEANQMKPGSAMGVLLTTGDFESASTGTVTANFGGKVIGFGHPFVQAGSVDFPMSSAYVHEVLPSLSISFKLSSPIAVLGTIFSDRPWSIGGRIGSQAKMVPVSVEVTDGVRHIRKKFSSRVIDHEDLTPDLVAACTMSAMDATYQSTAPYVARVETEVEVTDEPGIKRFDCLTNNSGSAPASSIFRPFFSDPVSGNIHSITSRILSNRYKKVHLKAVRLKINLESGRDLTRIVRISTDRPVVKPGENVTLNCLLEPYNGESYTENIEVTIPRDAPDGELALGVSGGSQLEDLRKRMNLVDPPTNSFEQIVRRLQEKPRGDRLFAVLALPNQSIHVDGEVLESPPGHWNKLFFSNRYTHGPSLVNGERRVNKEIPALVEGTHILAVTVKRPEPFMEKAPSYFAVPGGSGKAAMGAYVTAQAQKAIDSLNKTDGKPKIGDPSSATPADPNAAGANKSAQANTLSLWSPSTEDTHIRPVQVWSQTDDGAFKGGTKYGVIIDSWGRMFPGYKENSVTPVTGALRAWSAVWSNGAIYIGSSNRIYRWSAAQQKVGQIAKFNCAAIPAIVADSKGNVYASLAPEGRIVKINAAAGQKSASVTDVAKVTEPLVTCLAVDDDDTLYAGVAGTGRVYKVTASGASVLVDTGDAHVLSMFYDRVSRRLYVGCGEQGNVYSVSKAGELRAEFHSDDHLVTGVCRTKKGDLFITTAGTGRLLRITPSGETYDLATSDAFYTLYYHEPTDSVLAGDAEGDVTQIQEEPLTGQSFFVPVKHTDQEAVIALLSDGGNHIYAVSSNLPSIIEFSIKTDNAAYTSPVKDGARQSQWSLLRIYGSFNEVSADLEKSVSVETRTGATVRPDSTWSAWTPAITTSEGYQIKSPDDRYFQYRLGWLNTSVKGDSPRVFPQGRDSVIGRVAVTFLPSNSRPRFTSVSLRAGSYVSDTEEVVVVGSDPDGDSLSLAVDLSSDDGRTYAPLKSDIRADRTSKKDAKAEDKSEKKDSDKTKTTTGQTKVESTTVEKKADTITTEVDKSKASDGETPADRDSPSDSDPENPTGKNEKPPEVEKPTERDDSVPGRSGTTSGAEQYRNRRVNLEDENRPDGRKKPEDKFKPDSKHKPEEKNNPEEKINPEDRNDPEEDKYPEDKTNPDANNKPGPGEGDKPGGDSKPEDKTKPDEIKPGDKTKPEDKTKPDQKSKADEKNSVKKPVAKKGEKPAPAKAPAKEAAKAKRAADGDLSDKFTWTIAANTLKEGHHILRFTLSDAPSNMVQPADITCYRYIVIDTVKPVITEPTVTVSADRMLRCEVSAKDVTSPISNATIQIDSEEPRALAVVGSLADKREVQLLASNVLLKKGAKKIEIEVVDRAGNKATRTVRLPAR